VFTAIIPGEPVAQGRPKFATVHAKDGRSFTHAYDPKKSRNWKATAQETMRVALEEAQLSVPLFCAGAVYLEIVAIFTCPKGDWSKRNPLPRRWHTKRPDRDNVEKAVKDAASKILWLDDAQVASGRSVKVIGYQGEAPCLVVRAWLLNGPNRVGSYYAGAALPSSALDLFSVPGISGPLPQHQPTKPPAVTREQPALPFV